MAATPPLQVISSPDTPLTPLHGASYERNLTRQSSRIRQRIATQEPRSTSRAPTNDRQTSTPRTSRAPLNTGLLPQSPASTPRKTSRRVKVVSPSSPNTESTPPKPTKPQKSHLQPSLSSTTTMAEGMLPTPVKTPKKKNVVNASIAARALFQDQPDKIEVAAPSPRKGRKNKRYNGFSLESFTAEDGKKKGIDIFTDNRDKVPELDASSSNPFLEGQEIEDASHTRKMAGGPKRRKVSGAKPADAQVQEAIEKDDGMVYVFRGKKVYRRFDDDDEEEEVIDEEDLGLLEHAEHGAARVQPLKTLTRRSIRPTRLFQTEQQKLAREQAKEEEAPTDIEDDINGGVALEQPKTRSNGVEKRNRASPFDSWPRVKAGNRITSTGKGTKRSAAEAVDMDGQAGPSSAPITSNMKQKRTRV